MNDSEARFARKAVRRRRLFMALAVAGVAVAAVLSGLYGWWWLHDHAFEIGPRLVIILLILLNARQNLRQYRYAGVISGLMDGREEAPSSRASDSPAIRSAPGGDGGTGPAHRPMA